MSNVVFCMMVLIECVCLQICGGVFTKVLCPYDAVGYLK